MSDFFTFKNTKIKRSSVESIRVDDEIFIKLGYWLVGLSTAAITLFELVSGKAPIMTLLGGAVGFATLKFFAWMSCSCVRVYTSGGQRYKSPGGLSRERANEVAKYLQNIVDPNKTPYENPGFVLNPPKDLGNPWVPE